MDDIKNFVCKTLGLKKVDTYHFKKLYGLTFVFKSEVTSIKDSLTSAEISPVGIIYEENGEYYLAPLHHAVEIDEIVKEFVENVIIQEVECFHSQQ